MCYCCSIVLHFTHQVLFGKRLAGDQRVLLHLGTQVLPVNERISSLRLLHIYLWQTHGLVLLLSHLPLFADVLEGAKRFKLPGG